MPVRIEPRFIPPSRSEGSSLSRKHRDGKVMPMDWQPRSDRQIAMAVAWRVGVGLAFLLGGTALWTMLP
jgi:hypothetical protein